MENDGTVSFTYLKIELPSFFTNCIYLLHRGVKLQQGVVYSFSKVYRSDVRCLIHNWLTWEVPFRLVKDGKPFIVSVSRGHSVDRFIICSQIYSLNASGGRLCTLRFLDTKMH